jgi:hypothetical protein
MKENGISLENEWAVLYFPHNYTKKTDAHSCLSAMKRVTSDYQGPVLLMDCFYLKNCSSVLPLSHFLTKLIIDFKGDTAAGFRRYYIGLRYKDMTQPVVDELPSEWGQSI